MSKTAANIRSGARPGRSSAGSIPEPDRAPKRNAAANDESVALGLTHTGRVVTAAAVIMAISFAALMVAEVSFMRLFGFGLTVAVLVDATVVRTLLVPAYMHLLGRANWWAPRPLTALHGRFGLGDDGRVR